LNHALGDAINPQRPIVADANTHFRFQADFVAKVFLTFRRAIKIQPRTTARKLDSKTAARRFDYITRSWCNGAGIPQYFALHALRTHPANL
jgi:hypothetical protein